MLAELIDSLDRHEPKNAALYYRIAQPFARLACRSRQIIELTMAIIDRARAIEPSNSLFVTEFGCGNIHLYSLTPPPTHPTQLMSNQASVSHNPHT